MIVFERKEKRGLTARIPRILAAIDTADFFDVALFPEARFVSSRVEVLGGDRLRLLGELTLRGVTREVALQAEITGRTQDPWGTSLVLPLVLAGSRGAVAADSTSEKTLAAEQARIAENLANFDDLDFRRSLEGRRDGRGVSLLGQPGVHEADRPRAVTRATSTPGSLRRLGKEQG